MTYPLPGQPGVMQNNFGPFALDFHAYGSPNTSNVEPTPTSPPTYNSTHGVSSTNEFLSGIGQNVVQQSSPYLTNSSTLVLAGQRPMDACYYTGK